MEKSVTGEITINASASRIWPILTEPAWTKQYMFDCEAISEWKIGSSLIWKGTSDGIIYVKGHVIKFEPYSYIEYTVIDPNASYPDVPENYLTIKYRLEDKNGSTRLYVEQGDYSKVIDGEKRYNDSLGGWNFILEKIKTLAEK